MCGRESKRDGEPNNTDAPFGSRGVALNSYHKIQTLAFKMPLATNRGQPRPTKKGRSSRSAHANGLGDLQKRAADGKVLKCVLVYFFVLCRASMPAFCFFGWLVGFGGFTLYTYKHLILALLLLLKLVVEVEQQKR